MKKNLIILSVIALAAIQAATARDTYNFNRDWLLAIGDRSDGAAVRTADNDWKRVTLPRAHNEDEAYRVPIAELTDTVVWYRKHFRVPRGSKGRRVMVEFEGVRMAADFYLNGHPLGCHENGVMAVGLDLTPYINYTGDNVLAVRVDNDWDYRERATGQRYQWNDKNFNANYGGIPKNVRLHIADALHQTLPLYSNLGTTGTYIYPTEMEVASRRARINAETQVVNGSRRAADVACRVRIYDLDNREIADFTGERRRVAPGDTATLTASQTLGNLNFWSWGYGYLYRVVTSLVDATGRETDPVETRTGFRSTRFGNGKIWLNDRVIQMKGYAQRTSNEWPGVGMSVPPWMSDLSNGMLPEHNANMIRWMHVTAWRQDVESCDRVGVMQMLPAGDAEHDVDDRRWGQRTELMRDMIIYYRNNPSVIFYESGNESISREHMMEMRAIRDLYDPHGGRAIGSREMLDIREAEYGGEMLYVNKSEHHPMVQTEYCRDEGLRLYWDDWSYPYHRHGDGPLYRGKDASAYNQNQDQLALEMVRRWWDLYRERPGTGRRVNSGGAKIIFSDTQTHCRGAENYRRSGVVDAMRIPKDAYYCHRALWDGWVDTERHGIHIIGHWNYPEGTVKPVYVVTTADSVTLTLNGRALPVTPVRDSQFIFTFDSIAWQPGTLTATGYPADGSAPVTASVVTAGNPCALRLTLIQGPDGTRADGADMAMVQVEVTDSNGKRCPLANDMIRFTLRGPAEWRGGISQGEGNHALCDTLRAECGINRVLLRSLTEPGEVTLIAEATGLKADSITFATRAVDCIDGLSTDFPDRALRCRLDRGPTPQTPSYADSKVDVRVKDVRAGCNADRAAMSYDDNELSEWANDGRPETAWITYELERPAAIDDICIKLAGWRSRSYPIEVYAGGTLVWSGNTERSLGYVHLPLKPVTSRFITVKLQGAAVETDAFGQITELAADATDNAATRASKSDLRIVEIEFLETLRR